ncbi:MAG: deoxyhypusine synthase family protein [Deltaproteobacteria bacterium]|nr:deoxyhypusine synthase family protein [Deltaproteobacteria bacterium]
MSRTAFGGRSMGEAADVLYDMTTDDKCFVVGTFSGAMTVAKQGLLLCEMIDRGMLNAVVSTGALMTHGLVESYGMTHFKNDPSYSDEELFAAGYNRVYDTLELEKNLDDLEVFVQQALSLADGNGPLSSMDLCKRLGKRLHDQGGARGILVSAYNKGVPVYIPAFTDSELGLDFAIFNKTREIEGLEPVHFDPFLDLEDYTSRIAFAEKLGIFTIGGGVPRNWAQQVGPYLDILEKRLGHRYGCQKRFTYGVRICPEPVHFGGLSGCTYSEGISWGKFTPPSMGGKFAEVIADATVVWPVLLKAVIERLEKHGWRHGAAAYHSSSSTKEKV